MYRVAIKVCGSHWFRVGAGKQTSLVYPSGEAKSAAIYKGKGRE